jgi:plastocyanin
MTRRRTVAVVVAVGLIGTCGCDDSRDATRRRSAATPRATVAPGNGMVRGVVSFKGTVPEGEEVAGAKCHAAAGPITVSPVTVSPAGRLKDVVVYVKDAAPTAGPPPAAAVLDQVNCRYVPHVLAVRTGQVVTVRSSDPTLHNVHVLAVDNPGVNFGMTGAGQSRELTFAAPERVRFKCDVHPWMSAHVYVFDHPYFAVTADDGGYEIKGLAPGGHALVFSHPFLGDREQTVTVNGESPGTPAVVDACFEKGK